VSEITKYPDVGGEHAVGRTRAGSRALGTLLTEGSSHVSCSLLRELCLRMAPAVASVTRT